MPQSDEPDLIDGFASVLAVRRAKRRTERLSTLQPNAPRASDGQRLNPSQPGERGIAGRAHHSVTPAKFEIACYECGYAFHITGRLRETACPKCRTSLKTGNYVIDGEWYHSVRTIGDVEILSTARLGACEITARNIIVDGNCASAAIRSHGCLELWSGAIFDTSKLRVKNVIVRHGARFVLALPLECSNLEVEGELNAIVTADGIVTVRSTGFLLGEISCQNMIVEEGGGLDAQVCVGSKRNRSGRP